MNQRLPPGRHRHPFIINFQGYSKNPEQVHFTCPAEIDSDPATDIANIARIAWQALGCHVCIPDWESYRLGQKK